MPFWFVFWETSPSCHSFLFPIPLLQFRSLIWTTILASLFILLLLCSFYSISSFVFIPTAPVKVHVNSRRIILREKSMNLSKKKKWVTAKHTSRDRLKRFSFCTLMVSCWKMLCGLMNYLPSLTRLWITEKQAQCFLYVLPLHLAQMPDPWKILNKVLTN